MIIKILNAYVDDTQVVLKMYAYNLPRITYSSSYQHNFDYLVLCMINTRKYLNLVVPSLYTFTSIRTYLQN